MQHFSIRDTGICGLLALPILAHNYVYWNLMATHSSIDHEPYILISLSYVANNKLYMYNYTVLSYAYYSLSSSLFIMIKFFLGNLNYAQ